MPYQASWEIAFGEKTYKDVSKSSGSLAYQDHCPFMIRFLHNLQILVSNNTLEEFVESFSAHIVIT